MSICTVEVSGQEQRARGKQSMNWLRVCECVCVCVCVCVYKGKHELVTSCVFVCVYKY